MLDVKTVTARVSQQTERVDHAISGTMDRVDETAERVKGSVRDKVNQAVGVVRGDPRRHRVDHGHRVGPVGRSGRWKHLGDSKLPASAGDIETTKQEGTWRTNMIGSSGKTAADRS